MASYANSFNLQSTSILPQILLALIITIAVFVVFMLSETLYRTWLTFSAARIAVYPVTGNKKKVFIQNPNNTSPQAIHLPVSDNQLSGIEFSYSSFIYVADTTNTGNQGWASIFYKGYDSSPFPLCGPGVFVSTGNSGTNRPTLRVVMNTYSKWYNTIDVNEIVFNKWFHLAIVLKNNSLEVYINGNLANKLSFNGTLPYQNYENLIIFPDAKTDSSFNASSAATRGIPQGDQFLVNGAFTGYISNLYYFPYAITYSEIQSMMGMGPSNKFDNTGMDEPPYLIDTWWTQNKG